MKVSKRQRRLEWQKQTGIGSHVFIEQDLAGKNAPTGVTKAYKNDRYIVMLYENTLTTVGKSTKVAIQNFAGEKLINHWATIQDIKNQIFGYEVEAIEYYPKESELFDVANVYWIWIFHEYKLPKSLTLKSDRPE